MYVTTTIPWPAVAIAVVALGLVAALVAGRWRPLARRPGAPVLGYVTVPKRCPQRHAELFEQIEQIEAHCKRQGFRLVGVIRDEDPASRGTFERPGIAYALEQFATDSATALVVSDLTRLGRSRSEVDELMDRLAGRGVSIQALDTSKEAPVEEPAPVPRRIEPVARRVRRRGGRKVTAVGAAER